jgi:hypothetical protein
MIWAHFFNVAASIAIVTQHATVRVIQSVNSLTPKSVLAGTKNSRSEGFWLAKHNHTNIPTMMEPFPPPAAAAWF